MKQLEAMRVNSILDLAVEQDLAKNVIALKTDEIKEILKSDYEFASQTVKQLKETIEIASNVQENCVAIKLTCLISPLWLKTFSKAIENSTKSNDNNGSSNYNNQALHANEQYCIDSFSSYNSMTLLDELIEFAGSKNVKVMIDAEQTYFQPAIHYIANDLMKKYNKEKPVVYNTYQMYLKDGFRKMEEDFKAAKEHKYYFAVKLVRGAYIKSERELAFKLKLPDPINDTIEITHSQYFKGIDLFAANINEKIDLLLATHNQPSLEFAIDKFKSDYSKISFAQLLGMSDFLTLTLANNGFRTYKYLPFGPILEVIPYLIRRSIENSDVMASTSHDVFHIKNALKARFSPLPESSKAEKIKLK